MKATAEDMGRTLVRHCSVNLFDESFPRIRKCLAYLSDDSFSFGEIEERAYLDEIDRFGYAKTIMI